VGAHVFRHRRRVQAESARALDDDVIALFDAGAQQALGSRTHGAVYEAEDGVRQLVWDAKDRLVRRDVVVIGVGAGEVRRLAEGQAAAAVRAPVEVAVDALVAAMTGTDR
jgi:hypothetical protein